MNLTEKNKKPWFKPLSNVCLKHVVKLIMSDEPPTKFVTVNQNKRISSNCALSFTHNIFRFASVQMQMEYEN